MATELFDVIHEIKNMGNKIEMARKANSSPKFFTEVKSPMLLEAYALNADIIKALTAEVEQALASTELTPSSVAVPAA